MRERGEGLREADALQRHIEALLAVGLRTLPCWGGGKALPGTSFRELADAPPSPEECLAAGYSGGLAILCGTALAHGGYVLGIDVDAGPEAWPGWPVSTLYAEGGTAPGKWHLFVAAEDRLDGQLAIFRGGRLDLLQARAEGRAPAAVVELKGYGHALRSWPTVPEGKPRGYRPCYVAPPPGPGPRMTSRGNAEALADYYDRALGWEVYLPPRGGASGAFGRASGHLSASEAPLLLRAVLAELDRRGTYLKPRKAGQRADGRCPFHEDRHPSFWLNLDTGAWGCWVPGCGKGGLRSLARRLGIRIRPQAAWEVRA